MIKNVCGIILFVKNSEYINSTFITWLSLFSFLCSDRECNAQLKPFPRKIRRVSLNGEETRRTHVNIHVNHSTTERRRKKEREKEREKEKEPRINDRVGKRGIEPKWVGKASDMSKCEQLLDSPRERENSPSRETGEERENERGKKSYEPRGRERVPLLDVRTQSAKLVASPRSLPEATTRE